ncbi:hypothetical protein L1987_58793 [Smallanthus sonchifolius]|uniref:Uncharacterized protein n=1 Tax=Smallanthus sonchifolius TaxID=185202 RepID=A0ACB9D3S0_9ASTR|nr:hypothetical protein L1987_58793 [Smallanthus sonchifolius]
MKQLKEVKQRQIPNLTHTHSPGFFSQFILIAASVTRSCNRHFYSLMELTNITYLDQLEVSKDNYNLKVRIIKLWRQLEMGNVEETRAIHMILMDEKGHNKKDYPDVFDDLLEQKMAFKIDITNYNLQCMNTANRSYTISRMTDDSTIISTLEKKHRIEDASQSYSISGRSDNDTSQETVNLKGTLSVTDDNETPLSLRMPSTGRSTLADEKTRKTITHCDLKRNFMEVYDLDESPAQSSTKPRLFLNGQKKLISSNPSTNMHNYNRSTATPSSNIRHSSIRNNGMPRDTNNSAFGENSTVTMLQSGKHKLKRKSTNISPIPMVDLTSDEDVDEQEIVKNVCVGISKDYLDHGDQSFICEKCHSKLWKDEAFRGNKAQNKTSYSLCCSNAKVELPKYKEAPPIYQNLYCLLDSKSKMFMKNIRRYNSMFSFTSMGGKIDSSINRGGAPYIFRLSGQNYHTMGSLLPEHGSKPKFSQLYIYDTENEVSNRQGVFGELRNGSTSSSQLLDIEIIQYLKVMLDSNNELVKSYRIVRDCLHVNPQADLKLRLIGRRQQDGRMYNLPTSSEVAALIVGDIGDSFESRDIIVRTQAGSLHRISELHPSYLPLQYPLLFPYGDDGYKVDIPHRDVTSISKNKRQSCTMREFFAYRIQDRVNNFSLILNSRRLFQQFLVDAYTMVESERLFFIRKQQKVLRCESFENLRNVQNQGNTDISNLGQRVILPSSFTGGARYMMQNYLDAMSLCKWFGYPDFFITVTCNPKWPEIKRFLKDTTVNPEDRPDILCRLFKIKLDALIKDLKENSLLGKVQAVVYTVEFQKRGLPHSHICLFMHADHKLPTVEHIDPIISAEIPDKSEDPQLYALVSEFMMHGPCGSHNMNCPCMIDNKCSKNFPKKFSDQTSIDSDGFPLYRRRDSGLFVEKSGVKLDNRNVVAYNKLLLRRYQAHINVEWCNQGGSIKYLFKYINKGPDRATVAVVESNQECADDDDVVDEIKQYYDCRYLSACEASWRIFAYDVHYRTPSVMRLPFHLPGQQQVVYCEDDDLDSVLNKPTVASSMFLSWMKCNETYEHGRDLTYVEFPTQFVWKLKDRFKGPKSFEDILTVNGIQYPTFRDACYALGILDDDKEYIEAIEEASHSGSGYYLRALFATMLTSNSLSRPDFVWQNTWEYLSDGILYKQRLLLKSPDLTLNEDQIKSLTLFEIEQILLRNNSTLRNFSMMPYPNDELISSSNNRFINEELAYDRLSLQNEFDHLHKALTDEQRRTLSAAIRCKGEIVLNVASSGIASLLLTGGRTAHSRFLIPLNLTEDSLCHIKPQSDVACLLKKTKLIIWDEAPMIHKHAFEALDRTLRDILSSDNMNNSHLPFGGKVIVFGGDFRQILPVIPNGSRQDIINASLSSSYIWVKCKVLQLSKNMRLSVGNESSDVQQTKLFAKWLLDLGEGSIGGSNDGEAIIDIPDDLLITNSLDPVASLIDFVYPSFLENLRNPKFFQERAILAPTNEVVQEINDRLLSMFPGDEKEYLSSDTICQSEYLPDNFDQALYSPDVLNGLKLSGLSNHKLVLKVGVPVMLLRNIDQKSGLCNGTRLQVISLGNRVIEAEIISGSNIGSRTFIPRLSLTPSDKRIPFKFQRRQFPLAVCFVMTINKSQGQSLSKVGLFLRQPVFTHGQLYVALSRVTSRRGLKLLILDKDGQITSRTSNVVYKEVFGHL